MTEAGKLSAHDVKLVERRIGDCGCPEEEYLFEGIDLVVHYEPNGDADAHMDGGDWGEATTSIRGLPQDAAREAVFAWASNIVAAPSPPEPSP
jgi:hypothetical protein